MTVEPWGFIPRIAAIRAEDSAEPESRGVLGIFDRKSNLGSQGFFPLLSNKRGVGAKAK